MKELSPATVTYGVVSSTFRAISHIFFREIKTSGSHHVPKDGPVIFLVGPHHNQFVDGVVFFGVNPRPSYALMAAVSYNRPLIGHFGKILNAIPVVRPQDAVEKGTGTILYDPDTEPFMIYGQGTKFTQELNTRDFILFGRNYKVHVAKVISDTECEITHRVKVDDPSATYSFKIAPHVDQTPVYTEVNHYLNNDECITIFPEGGSHDRTELLPLKAGFAVMALGALAEYPDMDLKIVPVGLNYFHPDRFRSRVVVSYGQPLSLDRKDVELFKQGGKSKREAVTKLMDQSDEAFKLVTTSAPTYDALMVIQAARRLYAPAKQTKPTIQQVVKMNQNFGVGWTKLKDDPRQQELSRKVKIYNDTLNFFGIRDHQVEKLNITPLRAASLLLRRLVKLAILAGLGIPAFITNLPITALIHYISKKKQREALAGSMVKIKAKDVLATWKIIVAGFAAPALYGFYSLIYFLYLVKRRPWMSTRSKTLRACALWIIQPILHYFLMRLGDTGLDIYKSIGPLFLAIRNPAVGKLLREMRNNLSHDITDFVNQHNDIILPNDERQHDSSEEDAIHFGTPGTQDIDVEQQISDQENQQQLEMESVVLMVDGDDEQQSQMMPASSVVVSGGQSVEAY